MVPVGREKFSVIVAFGAGIALTATAAGIYSKIKSTDRKRKSRELIATKLEVLNETVEQLRKDFEEIKIASMRGSPFSLKPLDIDHLEAELDVVDAGIHRQYQSHSMCNSHFNQQRHHRTLSSGIRPNEERLELINSDPYTSSDETEEFFDFNDSDNNINNHDTGVIRANEGDNNDDNTNGHIGDDVFDNYDNSNVSSNGKLLDLSVLEDEIGPYYSEKDRDVKPVELCREDYLKEIDSCIDNPKVDLQSLYEKLCFMEEKFTPDAQIMWRKAKVCHLMASTAEKQGDKERKKELAFEKLTLARKALDLDDKCVDCHKWYAIAIGSMTDYVGTKEKIENGYEFKKHLDFALKLKPNDATLHHLLGRWACEVSNLSWLEKKLASSLFAQVPETSADEALESLLQAYKINPEWKQNIYYICKTLITLKRTKEVTEWIEKGLKCKIEDDDDQVVHDKLINLKAKYSK